MATKIRQFDFEITVMNEENGLPFDPYVRLCLKSWGDTTQDGAPTVSANLASEDEVDHYVSQLKADLDAVARVAKTRLAKAKAKTKKLVAQRANISL